MVAIGPTLDFQAIIHHNPYTIFYEILLACTLFLKLSVDMAVKLVPAHVSICRNEYADRLAKADLLKPIIHIL